MMRNVFITRILANNLRNINDLDIELSETERKHLILTGKNGSGKTTLLEAVRRNFVDCLNDRAVPTFPSYQSGKIKTYVSYSFMPAFEDVCCFFPAGSRRDSKRLANFVESMYDKRFQYLNAKEENDIEAAGRLQSWFDFFEGALREVYGLPELKLKAYPKDKGMYKIKLSPDYEIAFSQMSDGYAAFLDIVMGIMQVMSAKSERFDDYTRSGTVLIDEPENHLHVALQKSVLPFLARLFPNIQFVAATHSPFVVSSLENAIVYDLERRVRLNDASLYSYDEIVEGFYDANRNSFKAEADFARYKALCEDAELSADETRERIALRTRLEQVSPANRDLFLSFTEYERGNKNG
jgi:predicted ATP-binding protein involved in virulence